MGQVIRETDKQVSGKQVTVNWDANPGPDSLFTCLRITNYFT
jgi:hypothetical protein